MNSSMFNTPRVNCLSEIPLSAFSAKNGNAVDVLISSKLFLQNPPPKTRLQREIDKRKKGMRNLLRNGVDHKSIMAITVRRKPGGLFELTNGNTRVAVMRDAKRDADPTVYIPEDFKITVVDIASEEEADKFYLSFDNAGAVESKSDRLRGLHGKYNVVFDSKLKKGGYLTALRFSAALNGIDMGGKETETEAIFVKMLPVLRKLDATSAAKLSSCALAAAMYFYAKYMLRDGAIMDPPARGVQFFDMLADSDNDGGNPKKGMCPVLHVIRAKDKKEIDNHATAEGVRQYLVALEKFMNNERPKKMRPPAMDLLQTFWDKQLVKG